MSDYPEHDKLAKVSDETQAIGTFVEEFLARKGIELCRLEPSGRHSSSGAEEQYFPVLTPIQDLLAEAYGIDREKIDAEKMAMLEELRAG